MQSKGADSIQRIALTEDDDMSQQFGRLYYQLPEYDLTFEFIPTDFTQVNLSVNRQMTKLACDLLDLKAGERVLDLFSGSVTLACHSHASLVRQVLWLVLKVAKR